MYKVESMNLSQAKKAVYGILTKLQDQSTKDQFLAFLDADIVNGKESADVFMESIGEHIRELVPESAILPTEKLFEPVAGQVQII